MRVSFSTLKKHPKFQFIFLLLVFYIVSLFHIPVSQVLYLLISCVVFCVVTDLLLTYIKRRTFFIPYSAIISGLILTLIIDTSASVLQIFIICVVAVCAKNFIKISGKHIFNPAASGLLAGWVLFGLYPSWWSATLYNTGIISIQNAAVFTSIIFLSYVSCLRFRRYYSVLSFFCTFVLLSVLFSVFPNFKSVINTVFSPGTLFYAFVMLAEPMTSPARNTQQVLYGCFVAFINVLLVYLVATFGVRNLPDFSIAALLLGNLLFFKFR